jgi:hypothetical protein
VAAVETGISFADLVGDPDGLESILRVLADRARQSRQDDLMARLKRRM